MSKIYHSLDSNIHFDLNSVNGYRYWPPNLLTTGSSYHAKLSIYLNGIEIEIKGIEEIEDAIIVLNKELKDRYFVK